jgi:predicted RNase H-like HicB family nuclease
MAKEFFHAIAYRDGKYWVISFPDHQDLYTQAYTFKEVELMAKDVIHCAREIPISDIELAVTLYFDDNFGTEEMLEFKESVKDFPNPSRWDYLWWGFTEFFRYGKHS